jgi:LEA14-like dessication related protein
MTGKQKTYFIAVILGTISIFAAGAYLQIKKMTNNVIGFNKIQIKKISLNLIDFDLFLNYTNNSDIKFTLRKQTYDLFINNVYITTISNSMDNVIGKNSVSVIGMNVAFNPKDVWKKLNLNLLSDTSKIMIKLDMKMKVKVGFISVTIPYVYEDSLKNMMG